jgi:DNA-binding ferritin-like protein (Dps family)
MNKQVKQLKRLNNKLEEQLNEENREAYTDIICYLRVANISEYNQEIIRQDLLEMVLSAQERGENIQTVIGEDYRTFCDGVYLIGKH